MAMRAKPRGQRPVVGREDEKLHLPHTQHPGICSPTAHPLLQPWDTQTARAGTAVLLSWAQAERLVLDEMMASSRAFFRTTAMSVLQLSQNSVPGVW